MPHRVQPNLATAVGSSLTEQFLLACLRTCLNPDGLTEVRELVATAELDWSQIARVAVADRVAPLVYRVVAGADIVPADVETLWRSEGYRTVAHNALLRPRLDEAIQALEAASVPAIVMKGAALCATVYGWAGPRPMSDLDLLVRPAHRARAVQALLDLGYRRPRAEPRAGATFRFENAIALVRDEVILTALDVHWSLFDSPGLQRHVSINWFWQTAVRAPLDGRSVLVFGHEAQLLHLCGHLALHHRAQGLLWRHDIAALLHQHAGTLDWHVLQTQARAQGLVLPVCQIIPATAADWRIELEEDVLQELQALEPSGVEKKLYAGLTSGSTTVGRRFWRDLRSLPGWRERWLFLWSHLLPAPDYMRERYGIRRSVWLPFAYAYRWWLGLRSLLR